MGSQLAGRTWGERLGVISPGLPSGTLEARRGGGVGGAHVGLQDAEHPPGREGTDADLRRPCSQPPVPHRASHTGSWASGLLSD